jgi:predicted nucleic acid-binding protein
MLDDFKSSLTVCNQPVKKFSDFLFPQDDHILACAISSNVNYLVTGDDDLVVLGRLEEAEIVTPKAFEMFFK